MKKIQFPTSLPMVSRLFPSFGLSYPFTIQRDPPLTAANLLNLAFSPPSCPSARPIYIRRDVDDDEGGHGSDDDDEDTLSAHHHHPHAIESRADAAELDQGL